MNTIKLSEKQIQQAAMGYLRYKGFYVIRLNSGAIKSTNKYGVQHMVRLSEPGTPDVLAIKDGKCLFIEVKVAGNKPTILQTAKMKELESYGSRCIVAYSVQDLIDAGI